MNPQGYETRRYKGPTTYSGSKSFVSYSRFSILKVIMCYKVAMNFELVNPEPLLLEKSRV